MSGPDLQESLSHRGISRREFLKFCSVMAGTLALDATMAPRIARALQAPGKPPVVWLELQDCAGCTESFLRASRPTAAEIVLDVLSVNYHETIMAAAGHQAEAAKEETIRAGGHILIVEGSIPTAEDAAYCTIGGRRAKDILEEAASSAQAIICVGSCSAFGNLPAASPNPTGAVGVMDLITDKPIINLPGCPLNVVNLTATVVHYLTFNSLPELDDLKRPLFAHGARIHDNCERRGHFDAGEFVQEWGDEGHRKGWCLYQMGCKGPVAYYNCPTVRWNDGTSWPVGSGHGCIACAIPGFWDLAPMYEPIDIYEQKPPVQLPSVEQPAEAISPVSAGIIGGVAGAAIGAAAVATARQLSRPEQDQSGPKGEE